MADTRGSTFVMNAQPALSFSAFVLGLASTALIHLGEAPHPDSGSRGVDLTLARQSIEGARGPGHDIEGRATREAHQRLDPLLAQLPIRSRRWAVAPETEVHVAKGIVEDDGVEAGAGGR